MKIRNSVIVSAFAVLLAGCSGVFSPATTVYSPEAISKVTEDLKKISEKFIIEEVRVWEAEQLTGKFGMVSVAMRDKEGNVIYVE